MASTSVVASAISVDWLGPVGGVLALLGIVAAPITSGDTALRSARLMLADFFKVGQQTVMKRLSLSLPLFVVTLGLLVFSLSDAQGFKIIWRYFAFANQSLSVFTLWAITVFLVRKYPVPRYYLITCLPALFMTAVCTSYICVAPEVFGLPVAWTPFIGVGVAVIALLIFLWRKSAVRKANAC